MTQEIYTPPPDCPQPDEARAAVQIRLGQMVERVRQLGNVDIDTWPEPGFEYDLLERMVLSDILRCPAEDTEGCSKRTRCLLAQQVYARANKPS